MKIIYIGNLGNLSFNNVKALREKGVEADLYIPTTEVKRLGVKPPKWVVTWKPGLQSFPQRLLKIKEYDLAQPCAMGVTYTWLAFRPYVAHTMGSDLRKVALEKTIVGRLIRFGFKRADTVVFSNPDQIDVLRKIGVRRFKFIPQIIDLKKFVPKKVKSKKGEKYDLVLFNPSGMLFDIKGTNILIKGFQKFVERHKNKKILLRMVCWGRDKEKTKKLIKKMGLNKYVEFLPKMGKERLHENYLKANIVSDQFLIGSFGVIALEAMACGKPLLTYLSAKHAKQCYPELPPILNARTEDEIVERLSESLSIACLEEIGAKAREWICKYHDPGKIADEYITLYEKILSK